MAIRISLKDIDSPHYLSALVFGDLPGPVPAGSEIEKQRLEVYTGWIKFQFGAGSLDHAEIVSFLPSEGLNNVWDYRNNTNGGLFNGFGIVATVTVAPSDIRPSDGFANIVAVDNASVKLEKQPQLGSPSNPGGPNCLVLRVKIGASHADMRGITYQVTVLTRIPEIENTAGQTRPLINLLDNSAPN